MINVVDNDFYYRWGISPTVVNAYYSASFNQFGRFNFISTSCAKFYP